jgi:peptide deformylase
MSKKQLAAAMGFDPSYVSHVEARRHRPTEDFARRAEMVLQAGGAIWRSFREYDELRAAARLRAVAPGRDPPVPEQWLPQAAGLVVDQEIAELSYQDGQYVCRIRRALYNAGTEPITRYLARISVDRYPSQPDLSNQHYREHPLTWEELRLQASCAGEAMLWRAKTDRDSFKEVWLLFENAQGRFPLYPGQRAHIEYTYRVGADKWGQWFQRAIRYPTRRLTVRLYFPVALGPVVWGVESSLSTEAVPLRTPIEQEMDGERAVFSWTTYAPLLHARYRLEWRFRSAPAGMTGVSAGSAGPDGARASDRMRAAGIMQRGAEVLRTPARTFDLPREERAARDVVARLFAALDEVGVLHAFSKGQGLAAPQINLGYAAAVVRPAGPGAEPIVLLNPRVVDESTESDEQFEGCLSFFDVRGRVERPLWMDVETALFNGERVTTRYEQAVARLISHEVDHLFGRLYLDRMRPGSRLVPVEEYPETGRPWKY